MENIKYTPEEVREMVLLKMEKTFKKYAKELLDDIGDNLIIEYCKNPDWKIDFSINIKIKFKDKVIERKWN